MLANYCPYDQELAYKNSHRDSRCYRPENQPLGETNLNQFSVVLLQSLFRYGELRTGEVFDRIEVFRSWLDLGAVHRTMPSKTSDRTSSSRMLSSQCRFLSLSVIFIGVFLSQKVRLCVLGRHLRSNWKRSISLCLPRSESDCPR